MKRPTILTLLTLTLLNAGELEKEIRYLGNDGTKESHEIICTNGNNAVITIDNNTREITLDGKNLGTKMIHKAVEEVCR